MKHLRFIWLLLVIIVNGCSTTSGQSTVVWISIDGFRGDYLEKYHPPTLSRLAHEGAFTSHEVPIFPSITFPNHIAQVTGAGVDVHGIPLNTFYDSSDKKTYDFPEEHVFRAEPIWITAKRQGLRVATLDWPMTANQNEQYAADFFAEHFEKGKTDEQRLEQLSKILKEDRKSPPLRLVLSYLSHIDSVGHRNGPDSAEVWKSVLETDDLLAKFVPSTIEWFKATHSSQDELIFLFTADHGMTRVHTLVSLERALGADLSKNAKLLLGGPIACIDLSAIPQDQREQRAEQIVAKLKLMSMTSAWKSKDVPAQFHFADPSRIGDVTVLLRPGYSFTALRTATTLPVTTGSVANHGYDTAECPDMLGGAIVWRYRHPIGGIDLGSMDNTQWHATVARWLGIERSPQADPRFVVLP